MIYYKWKGWNGIWVWDIMWSLFVDVGWGIKIKCGDVLVIVCCSIIFGCIGNDID